MMLRRFLFSIFLLCISTAACADQLIIEPDAGRQPILDAINNTQHTLNVVMYGLTDEQLLNALMQKKAEGKTVKIILEQRPYKAEDENKRAISAFTNQNMHWQGSVPPFRLIHQKTLILDGKKAIVMTFNFTHSTFKKERNFALIIDDPQRVNDIQSVFAGDWNHHPIVNHPANLIWSPDDSREKIVTAIERAKNTIKIYAQSVNDYKMVGALAKAAHKGVQVQILTSNKLRQKQVDYLERAGVSIHYSKHYYIHAKVLIIDQQTAIIGSINLTRASLENNRELAVITQDPTVIKQLLNTFAQDWGTMHEISRKNQFNSALPDKRLLLRILRMTEKYLEKM